ncbi:MAG: amino acid transporter permease [Frankiales bacterium]|jgi:branched-chain amino acid transport system permease protein|nr:amino acid transporter permease [Frankiales bacterium]
MTVIWAGLSVGAIYAITALAYTIVFVPSGTFNFAQAFFVMLGTFLAYTTLVTWHLPFVAAVLVAGGVAALAGYLEERLALRPIRGRGSHAELVTTVGAGFVLTGISQLVWGSSPLSVPFFMSNASIDALGGRIRPNDVILIVLAVVLAVGLWLFSRRSIIGLASLAADEDPDAAQLKGINVARLSGLAVVVACALSGMVGPLIAPKTFASTSLGSSLVIVAFVAVVLGGFGSFIGAALGGFLMGLIEALGGRYLGVNYGNILILAVLVAVLLLRPNGLLGASANRRLV